jgi:hypothetical protein
MLSLNNERAASSPIASEASSETNSRRKFGNREPIILPNCLMIAATPGPQLGHLELLDALPRVLGNHPGQRHWLIQSASKASL